ncbi:hypothetical protein HAX54_045701, partial [Datura stramonium]|nr:hypothetical protein [Datura stramonium]
AQRVMEPTRWPRLRDTLPSRRGSAPAPSAMVRQVLIRSFSGPFSSTYGFQVCLTNARIGHLSAGNLRGVTEYFRQEGSDIEGIFPPPYFEWFWYNQNFLKL